MTELVKADGPACYLCAARTPADEGAICEVWKLGSSNKVGKKHRGGFVLGRTHSSGTTMRPTLCPHPDHKVSTVPSVQSMLRKIIK